MNIIQSFATESAGCARIHDLIREIAEFLTALGVKGNFHLTGDFARALRRQARFDVIRALARHELGYHCNHHGGRPFMGGYCERESWRDAVATWLAEELPGVRILAELFDRTPEYYTTEFAKAPQVLFGSWLAGIPTAGILLGQGPQGQSAPLPDGGQGAAWYCNSFVPTSRFLLSVDPQHEAYLEQMRRVLEHHRPEMADRPGVLRGFLHEYMLIRDPDRPGSGSNYEDTHYEDIAFAFLPEAAIAANLERMRQAFTELAALPGARFLGFSDYRRGYQPGHGQWLDLPAIDRLAAALAGTVDAVTLDAVSVSPAEAAAVLVRVLRGFRETGAWPERAAVRSVLGPTAEVKTGIPAGRLPFAGLLEGLRELDRALDDEACLPADIAAGGRRLGPGQWLQALARLYRTLRSDAGTPPEIDCPADTLPAIADDPFFRQTVFTRPIYPAGFTGERICRLSRLQAWSWKPAVPRPRGY